MAYENNTNRKDVKIIKNPNGLSVARGKDISYPESLNNIFELSKNIDFDKKREDYNKIQEEARLQRQASSLELSWNIENSSTQRKQYLKAYSDGLVRLIILNYQGAFVGNINPKLLAWNFIVSRDTIIISSNGNPIDINEEHLMHFIGRLKITRGEFYDYNLSKKKVHILTENNFVREQISGGIKKVMSKMHWQGNVVYKSPLRNTYNFVGDTWERQNKTFSDIDTKYDDLTISIDKEMKDAKKVFEKNYIGHVVESTAAINDIETKFIIPTKSFSNTMKEIRRRKPSTKKRKVVSKINKSSSAKYKLQKKKASLAKMSNIKRRSRMNTIGREPDTGSGGAGGGAQ